MLAKGVLGSHWLLLLIFAQNFNKKKWSHKSKHSGGDTNGLFINFSVVTRSNEPHPYMTGVTMAKLHEHLLNNSAKCDR